MRKISLVIILVISVSLKSCLVPGAPRRHIFLPLNSELDQNNSPGVMIFSTPLYKRYIIKNVDMKSEVCIKSPIFQNPDQFYVTKNEDYHGEDSKQIELKMKHRKFYKNNLYKNLTLKVTMNKSERIINYTLDENQ